MAIARQPRPAISSELADSISHVAVALVEAQPVRGRRRDQARRSTASWPAA